MEEDLKSWKKIWQEEQSSALDINELIKGLNNIERKEKRERLILLVTFPLTIVILLLVLPVGDSIYFILAIVLIGVAMAMILLQMFKSKFSKIADQSNFNNKAFLEKKISSLNQKIRTTSKYMSIYTLLLVLGLNIAYIEVLNSASLPVRITIHLLMTIAISCLMIWSIRKRMKRHEREVVPLISRLEALENQI